jgi:hypothetical protein
VVTGGQGNDIFTGVSALLTSTSTLNTTDNIVGGSGNDTLKLSMVKGNTAFTSGSISGVETVELTNDSENTLAFDATRVTGVETYTFNEANGPMTLVNANTGVKTINLNSQSKTAGVAGTTSFSFSYATDASEAATVATTDSLALNLNGVGTGTASTTRATVTVNSIETLNVALSGTNNATVTGSTLAKLNVSGSGTNTFNSVPTTLTSYDASLATGAITADLSAATGTITKVAGGSGNDVITYEEQDGSAVATLSGGAGTNELKLNSNGGVVEYTMTGFQTVTLNTVSAALTMSGSKTTDLTSIKTGTGLSSTATFANMGASNLTFTATGITPDGSGDAAADITSDHTGTTTLNYVNGTGTAATSANLPAADYSFTESTGLLTVSVGALDATTNSSVSAPKVSSVSVTVASAFDTAGTTELTQYNNVITANAAKSLTVNATGKLGTAAGFSSTAATSADITNGATAGNFTLTTPKLASLTVNTGNSLDLSASGAMTGLESANINVSKGTVTMGSVDKASSITLSGTGVTTGSSSQVIMGNLGGALPAANLSLSATGLKGGLSASTDNAVGPYVDVAKGFDIDINVSGTTGAVKFYNIGSAASNAPDDVTITATKATGNFSVGTILGTGNVTVNASGTTGTSTIGTVGGDVVVVDVSGTGAGSSVGVVTAKTSANVTYSSIEQTVNEIKAGTASTALAVAVKTGVLNDTVTVTGVSTQTSITVTGDLGASSTGTTDSLLLNSILSTSAQTINISGLLNYDTSTIVSGAGADTITGGAGADTIRGGRGADSLTGGAGADVFQFDAGSSTTLAPDTITDLGSTDEVWYGGGTVTLVSNVAATAGTRVSLDAFGVASFASETTTPASLPAAIALVESAIVFNMVDAGRAALFTYGGTNYMFIHDGTPGVSTTTDVLIKLTGTFTMPTVALVDNGTASTGLSGLGA